MATHSSVLAWRIPGTEEPGGLPSMGSQSRTRLKRLSSSSIGLKQYHLSLPDVVWLGSQLKVLPSETEALAGLQSHQGLGWFSKLTGCQQDSVPVAVGLRSHRRGLLAPVDHSQALILWSLHLGNRGGPTHQVPLWL